MSKVGWSMRPAKESQHNDMSPNSSVKRHLGHARADHTANGRVSSNRKTASGGCNSD